jgi:DNA-binding CsgD family transcriptional regulator/PAS domain-containing protein
MNSDPQNLLDLVRVLYEAASAPDLWKSFADHLARVIPCNASNMYSYNHSSGNYQLTYATKGVDQDYVDHYHSINPFFKRELLYPRSGGSIIRGEEIVPFETLFKTEFYQDHLRPHGVLHLINICVSSDRSMRSHLALSRPQEMDAFSEEETGLLRALLPHLQQALRIQKLFASYVSERRMMMEALDKLRQGVIAVAQTGRIIYINRSAKRIVDQRDGLSIDKQGLLQTSYPSETSHFRRLIKSACNLKSDPSVTCGGVLLLSRPSGLRPLSIMVAPLTEVALNPEVNQPAALVFINDPEQNVGTAEEVIRRLYGLTPAEARLATVLTQGKSVTQASEELEVTRNTARTHLKRIFQKTGAQRQSDLVKLLLNSPVILK